MIRIGPYGKKFYLLIFLLMIAGAAFGQRLKYKTSQVDGIFRGKRIGGEEVIELVNGVEYTQKDTRILCDSSLFYKRRNLFEAYNNITIFDGDSVTITADTLLYDGKTKKASLTGDVIYTAGTKKLYTDKLDYDLITKVSYFNTGGRLIDEQNDLTSKIGYYYSRIDQAIFYDSVRLKAESFDLATDTLKYFTTSKVAFTEGPTVIVTQSGNTINNIGGRYETVREKMDLVDGRVETRDYFLEGDELILDDYTQYYKAIGNVKLTAKNNDVIITGEEGYYDRLSGLSKVFGKPIMKKIMEVDTFYLSSDTLVAIESELDSAKRILGYKDVRIFRENLQAITDSVSYFLADSTIFMYRDPVLWTGEN
ncbi:MAG: OstA-like protein, partial [Bacteroidota bacterium]